MTQYNSVNVKLSNSKLNKWTSAIKNETEVALRSWSSMIANSNNQNNFPHRSLLTNTHVKSSWSFGK